MKRFLFLIFIALATVAMLLFLFNPEILESIWLWIIGLIGPIVVLIKKGADSLKNLVSTGGKKNTITSDNELDSRKKQETYELENKNLKERIKELENLLPESEANDNFTGTTITLLRYLDDGASTLGLLFLNQKFFCYTLEDTFREVKIAGNTRIPSGTYKLDFNRTITALTQRYRINYPWFDYHLQLKDVPGFAGVYIHVGNFHQDTEGCILIADGIGSQNNQLMITKSRQAYKRLYSDLKTLLDQQVQVRIMVKDESWFAQCTGIQNSQLIETP